MHLFSCEIFALLLFHQKLARSIWTERQFSQISSIRFAGFALELLSSGIQCCHCSFTSQYTGAMKQKMEADSSKNTRISK